VARLLKKDEELLKAIKKQAAKARDEQPSPNDAAGTSSEAQEAAEPADNTNDVSAVGLGVDLLEIERMEQAIKRTPRFVERVFTSGEREYAESKARPAVHYATFFAAREAVLKALGCGFSGVGLADVEITHDEKGKPEVLLHGNARVIAEQQGIKEIQISLSNTHFMAVASAVAIKAQSSPKKAMSESPMEELARQFKELRVLLDDLGVDTGDNSEGSVTSADSESSVTGADKEGSETGADNEGSEPSADSESSKTGKVDEASDTIKGIDNS